jgi:hypothetical protein
MNQKLLALTAFVCFAIAATAQTISSLAAETGNNTSACSADGTPSYCTETLPTLTSNSSYEGYVQTYYLTPTPGHVSPLTIEQSYLYSGATTRVIAAYQPWFAPESGGSYNCYPYPEGGYTGTALHPCTGYSENDTATVTEQHTTMIARGFTDVSPDWYGNSTGQTFLNQTVLDEAADLASRCSGSSCPLHLMIMIDGGTITSGMQGAPACTGTITTSCVITVLEKAYDYIDSEWGRQVYYSTDAASGWPITLIFITESNYPDVNWSSGSTSVWGTLKSYMSKYKTPYKVVREFGTFTEPYLDGAYAWPQSTTFSDSSPDTQYCWQGWTGSACDTYMNRFYSQSKGSGEIVMGGLYIGFDGSNNNYNHDVMARQCGQVMDFLASAITGGGYGTSLQLPWLLAATWNDYGEATNIESGVDNCWRVNTPTISTTTITWTQTQTDTTYASPSTIDHFRIWYGPQNGSTLTLSQDNILPSQACNSAVTTCSFNLANATFPPPNGNYIFVEQIPKALLFTEMDGGGNGNGDPVLYNGGGGGTVISNINAPPYTWSQVSGTATSTVTQDVSSPSLDGLSAQFTLTAAPSYSLAKWESSEIGTNGQYDSMTHFTLNLYVEVSSPSLPQSLEFSVSQAVSGNDYPFHFQCDFKGSGYWEVWVPTSETWSDTTAPCPTFAASTFTELTFDVQRTSGNQLQYNWLEVNGQQYSINQTFNPSTETPDNVDVGTVLHVDEEGDLYTIWIDEMSLTMQ